MGYLLVISSYRSYEPISYILNAELRLGTGQGSGQNRSSYENLRGGIMNPDEVVKYPFMQEVMCSFCEMEPVTRHAWDDRTKPTEQMCAYCQREIQS